MRRVYRALARQRQEWHINFHLNPEQPPPLVKWKINLPLPFDRNAVERAFRMTVVKHATLRIFFPVIDGEIVQVVAQYDGDFFGLHFLPDETAEGVEQSVKQLIFDIKEIKRPPLMVGIVHECQERAVFVLYIHHILCDAWSMSIIQRDLTEFYFRSEETEASMESDDRHSQLGEYAERVQQQQEAMQRSSIDSWLRKLSGLEWQTDFNKIYNQLAASKIQKFLGWENLTQFSLYQNSIGEVYAIYMATDLYKGLLDFCNRANVSVFSMLVAGWAILGMQLTGTRSVLIRTFFNNRDDESNNEVVGNLIVDILMFLNLNDTESIRQFITKSYYMFFDSVKEKIYDSEELETINAWTRCFMMFNFLSRELADSEERNIEEPVVMSNNQTWSPFFCNACEFNNTISFHCGYHLSFFDSELVDTIFKRYFQVLDAILANPDTKAVSLL
jgi:Condensation domain